MALFFPLDVEYASDDEFIEAGPLAELLFIRAGCFIKRKRQDGKLRKSQLPLVAAGISNPKRHAAALVTVGLWVDDGDEWTVPSYLKHNPSKAHLDAAKEIAADSGTRGAHTRWHLPPDGSPSSKCPLCIADRMGKPIGDPIGDPNASLIGSDSQQEPIGKGTHREPTDNPRTTSIASTDSSSSNLSHPNGKDPRFETVVALLVDADIAEYGPMSQTSPGSYRASCVNKLLRNHGPTIRRWLDERPDAPADTAVRALRQEMNR